MAISEFYTESEKYMFYGERVMWEFPFETHLADNMYCYSFFINGG